MLAFSKVTIFSHDIQDIPFGKTFVMHGGAPHVLWERGGWG